MIQKRLRVTTLTKNNWEKSNIAIQNLKKFIAPKLFLILGGPILFWPTVSCTIDRLHGILQLPHSKNIFARQSF